MLNKVNQSHFKLARGLQTESGKNLFLESNDFNYEQISLKRILS